MEQSNANCDLETGICSSNNTSESSIETTSLLTKEKMKITYYYDALCGWCYGFTNAFKQFKEAHQNNIDFEIVSGGLFLGASIGKINDVAPYIKQGAYKSVEEITGVNFGKLFLNKLLGDGNIILNSLPPAIALCIVKKHKPQKRLKFAELLLNAVYKDGIDISNFNEYAPYLTQIDFDTTLFNNLTTQEEFKIAASKEFDSFSSQKLNGMPSLVIEYKNIKSVLSNGYASYSDLEKRLEHFKNVYTPKVDVL